MEQTNILRYIPIAPLTSVPPHHPLVAPTQPWQAEAFSVVETQYTKLVLVGFARDSLH
jgi:hypothetical protein